MCYKGLILGFKQNLPKICKCTGSLNLVSSNPKVQWLWQASGQLLVFLHSILCSPQCWLDPWGKGKELGLPNFKKADEFVVEQMRFFDVCVPLSWVALQGSVTLISVSQTYATSSFYLSSNYLCSSLTRMQAMLTPGRRDRMEEAAVLPSSNSDCDANGSQSRSDKL